jgi:hypothetical protein
MNNTSNLSSFKKASRFSYIKQAYCVKKIDLDKEESLRNEIDVLFTDPNKYLDTNARDNGMIIGRMFKFPRLDKYSNLKTYSVVGTPEMFTRRSTITGLHGINKKKMSWKDSGKNIIAATLPLFREKKTDKTTEIVSDKRLGEIYNKFKIIKKMNSEKVNEFIDEVGGEAVARGDLKNRLLQQEKCLIKNQQNQKINEDMIKMISSRTNKRNEDILMNQTDSFRIRKEVKNIIESKKPVEQRYGQNHWVISLRKPENFKGTRDAWINLGSKNVPHWSLIKDKTPVELSEKIRKPDSRSQTFKDVFSLSKSSSAYFNNTLRKLKINLEEDNDRINTITVSIFIYFIFIFR